MHECNSPLVKALYTFAKTCFKWNENITAALLAFCSAAA